MKKPLSRTALMILLAAVSATVGTAWAQQGRGQGQDRGDDRGHDRGEDRRGLSDSVRRVERRTGGQVLSAERVPYDGRDVNRVKVVDSSGRVRIYMDDPQSQSRGRDPQDDPTRRNDD
ncbi:hypothetical protein [Lysobacter panacisoli]|uniref:PepSY domain-containing protein n=1 Tax=Lysobacter panacisoli TaxID=1255263 RepID=A0ABP9L7C1_9GAMM|nr:hypothetical protein [Lysobacter panacisoli]